MEIFIGVVKKGVFMKRILNRIIIEEENFFFYKKRIFFMKKKLGV